jgi:uncharacterized iron-regulated membrane protein
MRLSPILFRRIHKWIGLILGLQFVIWTISGAMMAVLDMGEVAGGERLAAVETAALPRSGQGWEAVRQTLGETPITTVAVRPLLGRHVLEVGTPAGPRLFDPGTGAAIEVDASLARKVAEASYPGAGEVASVTALEELTLPVREHSLPIWRVDFADDNDSSYYVSASTGKLLERRNDTWRAWDFFWMLHNMDYVNRTSFNHPLIITVGFGIVWLAITGFYLLFKSAWRTDFRWLRQRRVGRSVTVPASGAFHERDH